jgi:hypothetical protein
MSTGIMHCSYGGAPGNGTQGEFAASGLTNKVMSGTIPTSNNFCPPALIVAITNKHPFGIVADSLGVGVGEGAPDVTLDIGFARAISGVFAYQKQVVGGETMANFMGMNGAKRRAALQYASHIACFYGRNDVNNTNGAQLRADRMTALAALFPTKPLILSTTTPATTSIDNWATAGNQTALTQEAERVKYNEILRGGQIPGVAGFIDHAAAVETNLNSGLWMPGLVSTTDSAGVHACTAGYLAIRQATMSAVMRLGSLRA